MGRGDRVELYCYKKKRKQVTRKRGGTQANEEKEEKAVGSTEKESGNQRSDHPQNKRRWAKKAFPGGMCPVMAYE